MRRSPTTTLKNRVHEAFEGACKPLPLFKSIREIPEIVDIPETLSTDDPTQHRVVIAGGGAAGLELATWLGRRLGKRKAASITLVDRSRTHVWKPLLHEVASGSLDSEVDAIEFIPHAVKHGYRYRIGAMYGIDREKRQIYVEPSYDDEGQEIIPHRVIGYDTLVIAVGGGESGKAALASAKLTEDLRMWVDDPDGESSYPIASFTWMLFYKKQETKKAEALRDIVEYCLTDGQKIADQMGYIPLPENVVEKVGVAAQQIQ